MRKVLTTLILFVGLASCNKSTFELNELNGNPFDPDYDGPSRIVYTDGSFIDGDQFYVRFRIDRTTLGEDEDFYVHLTRPDGQQVVYYTRFMEFDVFTDPVTYPGPGVTLCWQVGVGTNTSSGGRSPLCATTP